MSSNSPTQGKAIYYYEAQNKQVWVNSPIDCYEWLREAYPDIAKEFMVVMEVAR